MWIKRKQVDEQRDRIIHYKRTFGGEGRSVLFDLMNRFHVLNAHDGDAFKEGQRSVVLHILAQCQINLEEFDKILKGELNESA